MRSWLAVVLSTVVTGCVVYKDHDQTPGGGGQDGQVDVNWVVGSSGCEGSGIDRIVVTIGQEVQEFACSDESGTLTVPSGTWDVSLEGLDADGLPRYGGDGGVVTVYGGQSTSVPTVVLSGLPARVTATWFFADGHLCSSHGVEDVELDLFDADDTIQATITTSCDDGVALLEDVEAGAYALNLYGRDATGKTTYVGTTQLTLERGDDAQVDVPLEEK